MFRKIIITVVAVGAVAMIVATIAQKKNHGVPGQQTERGQKRLGTSKIPTPQSSPTVTTVHPSNQAASWGFETEAVIARATAKSNHDLLRVQLLSGQSGDVPIQYEGGTEQDRWARIVTDPTRSNNHVLSFLLKNARVPGSRPGYEKGRVQLHLSGINKPQSYARFRMYLSPDLAAYRAYPKENHWFTLSELWSRPTENKHFRITLNLAKEVGVGQPLRFVVSADKQVGGKRGSEIWKNIWGEADMNFEVPVGEWIDVEIGYAQGDASSGRFYLAAKRASDPVPVTIFDVKDWTYNPDAKNPSLLTEWDIFKLYTSGEVIDFIRNQGGVAQIYWDDLEIFDAWQ